MTLVPHLWPQYLKLLWVVQPLFAVLHMDDGEWGITKILYSGRLYSLPGAAVTNYYEPGGLK